MILRNGSLQNVHPLDKLSNGTELKNARSVITAKGDENDFAICHQASA
jgi:hypothetical protein